MSVAMYMLKKLAVMKRIGELPEEEGKRITPLWTTLSELEFQPEKVGVVGMYGVLALLTLFFVGVFMGFSPKDKDFLTWGINPFLLGIVCGAIAFALSGGIFWLFFLKPERQKVIVAIRKMIVEDPSLPEAVAGIDPKLAKRFSKFLQKR